MCNLLALLLPIPVHTANHAGRVVSISDGDSVNLIDSANLQHYLNFT